MSDLTQHDRDQINQSLSRIRVRLNDLEDKAINTAAALHDVQQKIVDLELNLEAM